MCLSPMVPHVCHVLWLALGHERALIDELWPQPDPQALVQETVELVVQVNGKLRGRVRVVAGADESQRARRCTWRCRGAPLRGRSAARGA